MQHFVLGSRYYYARLSVPEKTIYRQIYESWVTGGTVATLTLPGTDFTLPSGKQLHDIVTFIIHDNPHLFHLELSQFTYNRFGTTVTVQANNVYSPQEYQSIYKQLTAKVRQIVQLANSYPTDYDKLRFVHDYLAKNITYFKGSSHPRSQREVHTIVGALLNKACVCDGYARAYRLLCDRLHLSCIVVLGESSAMGTVEPHAWNIVRMNDTVYHVDVTWDSCMIVNGSPVSDYYFLRSDAVFQKSHSWNRVLYPPVTADYPRTEPTIGSNEELERYLCDRVLAGQHTISLYFHDSFPGIDTLQKLIGKIIDRNPRTFTGIQKYQCSYSDDIKHAIITLSS